MDFSDHENGERRQLDPWRVILSCLFEMDSHQIPHIIDATGLSVNWTLTGNEGYSDRYRKTAFRPRINSAYEALGKEDRLRVAFIVIHRDTRFSPDKTPYKTNVGCNFRHRAGKDAHAPGFYVHIAPDEVFFGGGIWSPPTSVLNRIRDAIVEDPERWLAIQKAPAFTGVLGGLGRGQSLKNAPRGYPHDHPCIDDLKRKSLFAFASCTESQVCDSDFPDRVIEAFEALSPLLQFMVWALDLDWDS